MNTQETKSTAAHTPGPWRIEDTHERCLQIKSDAVPVNHAPSDMAEYYRSIASVTQRDRHPVYDGEISTKQCLANARLIAAAPELLEATILASKTVRSLIFQLPRGASTELKAEFELHARVMDAAIARATQVSSEAVPQAEAGR